jgi:DNA invertase Pin-like site-specific DNA recombinase
MRAIQNKAARVRRALGLFVVRESNENDDVQFDGMRQQTYAKYRTSQAVQEVRAAGMAPLTQDVIWIQTTVDGEPREVEVPVELLVEGGTKAYLFFWRGFWHLWSQASAAKLGRNRSTNEFTDILIRVIEEKRPMAVFAANFSRLIRSQWQGGRLMAAMQGNVDVVVTGETRFQLTGEAAANGLLMFSMFATVASMERNWIVQRLVAGRIASWRRDEWPFADRISLLGYAFDSNSKKLVLDPDPKVRERVRDMLMVLVGDAPPAEMVRQLSDLGCTVVRRQNGKTERVPASAAQAPGEYVAALYSWAPVWCAGEYLWRHRNAFPGVRELAGVPVVYMPKEEGRQEVDPAAALLRELGVGELASELRDLVTSQDGDDLDAGELQMLLKVPLPEGGWAEPELLEAFAQKSIERSQAKLESTVLRPLSAAVAEKSANAALHERIVARTVRIDDFDGHGSRVSTSRGKSKIAAFAGRSWVRDGWVYEMAVASGALLKVVRHPLAARAAMEAVASAELIVDIEDDLWVSDDVEEYDLEELM